MVKLQLGWVFCGRLILKAWELAGRMTIQRGRVRMRKRQCKKVLNVVRGDKRPRYDLKDYVWCEGCQRAYPTTNLKFGWGPDPDLAGYGPVGQISCPLCGSSATGQRGASPEPT